MMPGAISTSLELRVSTQDAASAQHHHEARACATCATILHNSVAFRMACLGRLCFRAPTTGVQGVTLVNEACTAFAASVSGFVELCDFVVSTMLRKGS
jgi:hypothetical protein